MFFQNKVFLIHINITKYKQFSGNTEGEFAQKLRTAKTNPDLSIGPLKPVRSLVLLRF